MDTACFPFMNCLHNQINWEHNIYFSLWIINSLLVAKNNWITYACYKSEFLKDEDEKVQMISCYDRLQNILLDPH